MMTQTIYDAIGEEKILQIAQLFYKGIADDDLLKAMYPKDLEPAEERLALFLVQVFGGPTTYSDKRGHPRLRRRHFPYSIGMKARAHWLSHIQKAVQQVEMPEEVRTEMMNYFERAATHMMNSNDEAH